MRLLPSTGFVLIAALLSSTASAATRVVDDDGEATASNCSSGTDTPYTTIGQALADSVAGDKIIVCSGIYNEQIIINVRVTITGKLDPADPNTPTIRPDPMAANTTSLASGNPIAAVILVNGATANATIIDQLTVDAVDNAFGGSCAVPNIIGVYFRNASGTIKNSVVKNTLMADPALLGCQVGLGIFAQSDDIGGVASVIASDNSVHHYGKNGITGNEPGTTLTATKNTVTGLGATLATAQNGIQIGFDAKGTVTGNVVTGHYYSACAVITDAACNNGSASGILLYQAATPTIATGNTVATSQVGVYLDGSGGTIGTNRISDTIVYDGIYVSGDMNTITQNTVTDSDESGIWVDGTGNTVQKNVINEAPIGIVGDGGSNTITLTGSGKNTFFNVGVQLGPVPVSFAATSSAVASPAR